MLLICKNKSAWILIYVNINFSFNSGFKYCCFPVFERIVSFTEKQTVR